MIISPDGTIDIETVLDGSLEQLQKIVGGYIQILPINCNGYKYMVCNEEGLRLGLWINNIATKIYGRQILGTAILAREGEIK